MCCGSYPDPSGYIIANLKRGDEVLVRKGFGNPPVKEDKVLVIAQIGGFSAVCTDGTRLMCGDGWGVEATGEKKPVNFFTKAITSVVPRQSPQILRFLNGNTK